MSSTKITDHLANERTFLAWVRTSIALMGFGVVIARLRFLVIELAGHVPASTHMTNRSTWLGLAFASVGLITLAFATYSYNRTRHAIDAGSYEPLGTSLFAVSGVIFLLGLFAIAYLLTLANF